MNTYNHHRIIKWVANKISEEHPQVFSYLNMDIRTVIEILEKASDFTDDFIEAEWKYFLYHFYYDLHVENNTIILERVDEKTNRSDKSMENCDTQKLSSSWNEKEFFSIINERPKSRKMEWGDASNQSDNVAFLHAMGCEGSNLKDSKKLFIEHLLKCFAEYLFIQDNKKALFMLGIAFHSIMDSFTPSHTGFKKFSEQNKAKHAQGDVIPFRGDSVYFDPAQLTEDIESAKIVDDKTLLKLKAQAFGYDSDYIINNTENEMLKIFIKSYLDTADSDIKNILSKNSFLPKGTSNLLLSSGLVGYSSYNLLGINRNSVNAVLEKKEYKTEAFDFSEKAIAVIVRLFEELTKKRKDCLNNYEKYRKEKENISMIIEEKNVPAILEYWQTEYESIQNHSATKEDLYKK